MTFKYFQNDFQMVPAAPILTGITYVLIFYMRCICMLRSCIFYNFLGFIIIWSGYVQERLTPYPKIKAIHTQLPEYILTTRKLMRIFIYAYFILSLQGYKLCNRVIYLNSSFICRVTQILFWLQLLCYYSRPWNAIRICYDVIQHDRAISIRPVDQKPTRTLLCLGQIKVTTSGDSITIPAAVWEDGRKAEHSHKSDPKKGYNSVFLMWAVCSSWHGILNSDRVRIRWRRRRIRWRRIRRIIIRWRRRRTRWRIRRRIIRWRRRRRRGRMRCRLNSNSSEPDTAYKKMAKLHTREQKVRIADKTWFLSISKSEEQSLLFVTVTYVAQHLQVLGLKLHEDLVTISNSSLPLLRLSYNIWRLRGLLRVRNSLLAG